MIAKLTNAKYLKDYAIHVIFSDGKQGKVDLKNCLWGEVFEPLRDINRFKTFKLDANLKTIVWDNGADIAPEYLYRNIQDL